MTRKRVLVTGAGRGIGRAIAIELAAMDFAITVHYRKGQREAESTVEDIIRNGGEAELLAFDIADRDATSAALENVLEQRGAYWGVVCNAGITADNAFPAMPAEDWDSVIGTNLGGFFNVVHPLVMPMVRKRDGGRIVTIASVSGLIGNRGQVNYSAAKAGVIGASKALAVELASRRITVNCVAPGFITTDMTRDAPVEEAMKLIPAQRPGTPEEVAGLVGFLFSEKAAYITRQAISVNGGMF
ncbi:MAG: 3-oxoacyl-ACP reductase FabG [Proteobacteria bacterium]|nr:3-oxoacyl-ACP reductase FabG [Pseudomonadota bacterium]